MRLALVLRDDNGSVEAASVECDNFAGGCYQLNCALSDALWFYRSDCLPASTATLPPETANIISMLTLLGGEYELRPTVSC